MCWVVCTSRVSWLRGLAVLYRWLPWSGAYVDAVSGRALKAFSGEVQSCSHLHPQVPDSYPTCPDGLSSEAASPEAGRSPLGYGGLVTVALFPGLKTENGPAFNDWGLLKPARALDGEMSATDPKYLGYIGAWRHTCEIQSRQKDAGQ